MLPPLDIENVSDLPGGIHFRDVTNLFVDGSHDMDSESMVMAEGYTLNEAMSAIEIGDPRMDTGSILPEEVLQPDFDPMTPLLPEEVCWIMDRMFACEMEWHAGYTLPQTVHTCMYMHHLEVIDPEHMNRFHELIPWTKERPAKLISLVIRAATLGMVKCCDLAFRELVKGNVYEGEDWQGEKFEIRLCEDVPVMNILAVLESAESWILSEEAEGISFAIDLFHRIRLRKSILRLYTHEPSSMNSQLSPLVRDARDSLDYIRKHPIDSPPSDSAALAAFDPHVSRKLHSLMPLKVLILPSQEEVWFSVTGLLDGWREMVLLGGCESILAWNTISRLRTCTNRWCRKRLPFVRSSTKTLFCDGVRILTRYPYLWMVETFFLELTNINLSRLNNFFARRWIGVSSHSFDDFQENLSKLIVQHIWSSFKNRPRYRRFLMKSAVDWKLLHSESLNMIAKVKPRDEAEAHLAQSVPLAILHFLLVVIRDIVLTGFELELYSSDERSFAYWYLAKICDGQTRVLKRLLEIIPINTPASRYLSTQREYSSGLGALAAALSHILMYRKSRLSSDRREMNFMVRYKWATEQMTNVSDYSDPFRPNFHEFLLQERQIQGFHDRKPGRFVISTIKRAKDHFGLLEEWIRQDETLRLCREDFEEVLLIPLQSTCDNLLKIVLSEHDYGLVASRLVFDVDICPWFPQYKLL